MNCTAQPLSTSDAKPEAPSSYVPPTADSKTTNGATEKIVTDPFEETPEQLVARCHEIMKQVRLSYEKQPRRELITRHGHSNK